jgi:uncharacterized OsmC-like protein
MRRQRCGGSYPHFTLIEGMHFISIQCSHSLIVLSTNKVTVIRKANGDTQILFNNKDMQDMEIKNIDKSAFSCGRLIAAAALVCLTGSFPDELGKMKPDAKYGEIRASASYTIRKYDSERYIADHMDIELEAEVSDEDLKEHQAVVKRHEEHGCLWTRSLKKGFKINFHFKMT